MTTSHPSSPWTPEAAHTFGQQWAQSWNRRDIEAVLSHFTEDCSFESPFAEKHAGTNRVRGKAALRTYWQKAIGDIGDIHFAVDFVAANATKRAITIVYRAHLGQRHLHACERLIFNEQGLVSSGMGLYGPPVLSE